MTIDEAIIKYKNRIEQYKDYSSMKDIAKEYEQLADWLCELKELWKNHGELCNFWYLEGYNKAIEEFAERVKERLIGMQMAELQGEDVCPCAETGEDCPYIHQELGCQYCAREQTIKDIDEIAESMKGE